MFLFISLYTSKLRLIYEQHAIYALRSKITKIFIWYKHDNTLLYIFNILEG